MSKNPNFSANPVAELPVNLTICANLKRYRPSPVSKPKKVSHPLNLLLNFVILTRNCTVFP